MNKVIIKKLLIPMDQPTLDIYEEMKFEDGDLKRGGSRLIRKLIRDEWKRRHPESESETWPVSV